MYSFVETIRRPRVLDPTITGHSDHTREDVLSAFTSSVVSRGARSVFFLRFCYMPNKDVIGDRLNQYRVRNVIL